MSRTIVSAWCILLISTCLVVGNEVTVHEDGELPESITPAVDPFTEPTPVVDPFTPEIDEDGSMDILDSLFTTEIASFENGESNQPSTPYAEEFRTDFFTSVPVVHIDQTRLPQDHSSPGSKEEEDRTVDPLSSKSTIKASVGYEASTAPSGPSAGETASPKPITSMPIISNSNTASDTIGVSTLPRVNKTTVTDLSTPTYHSTELAKPISTTETAAVTKTDFSDSETNATQNVSSTVEISSLGYPNHSSEDTSPSPQQAESTTSSTQYDKDVSITQETTNTDTAETTLIPGSELVSNPYIANTTVNTDASMVQSTKLPTTLIDIIATDRHSSKTDNEDKRSPTVSPNLSTKPTSPKEPTQSTNSINVTSGFQSTSTITNTSSLPPLLDETTSISSSGNTPIFENVTKETIAEKTRSPMVSKNPITVETISTTEKSELEATVIVHTDETSEANQNVSTQTQPETVTSTLTPTVARNDSTSETTAKLPGSSLTTEPHVDLSTTTSEPHVDTSMMPSEKHVNTSTTPLEPHVDTSTTPLEPHVDTSTTSLEPHVDTSTTPKEPFVNMSTTTPKPYGDTTLGPQDNTSSTTLGPHGNTSLATPEPHIGTSTTTPEPYVKTSSTTPEPYVKTSTTTPEPYVKTSTTTPEPYVKTSSTTPDSYVKTSSTTPEPYVKTSTTTPEPYVKTSTTTPEQHVNTSSTTSEPHVDMSSTTPQSQVETSTSTSKPHVLSSTTTPEPHVDSTTTTTPEPHVDSTATTTPEPHIDSTTTTTPEPHVDSTTTTTPEPHVDSTTTTTPEPHVDSTTTTTPVGTDQPGTDPSVHVTFTDFPVTWSTHFTSGMTTWSTTGVEFTESEIRRISADRKMFRLFYTPTPGRILYRMGTFWPLTTCLPYPFGFPPYGPDIPGTLISLSDFSESYTCGMCLLVSEPDKTDQKLVRVSGVCEECEKGDLIFTEVSAIVNTRRISTNVTFQAVMCPTGGTMLTYTFSKSNLIKGRVHLRVHNSRYPITRMQLRRTELGEWEKMGHTTDSNFFYNGAALDSTFYIRTYAYNGLNVVDRFTYLVNRIPYVGGQQMPVLDDHIEYYDDPEQAQPDHFAASPGETILIVKTRPGSKVIDAGRDDNLFVENLVPTLRNGSDRMPGSWLRSGRNNLDLLLDLTTENPATGQTTEKSATTQTQSTNLTNYGINASMWTPGGLVNDNNIAPDMHAQVVLVLAGILCWVRLAYH